MNKTILFLSFFLLNLATVQGQWDGVVDIDVDLSTLTNKTYKNSVEAITPLIIQGKTLVDTCALMNTIPIEVADNGSNAIVTMCGATDTFEYVLNKVTLTNANGIKLNFFKSLNTQDTVHFDFTISPDTLNVYYDALVLLRGSLSQKKIIYKKYKLNQSSVNAFFSANVISELSSLQSAGESSATNFANSNASGINVTKFADGFAKFIASQFKKELTISFFNRFKNKLNNNNLRDLRTLFENTTSELNLIDKQFVHYDAYLSSLRQSMEIDCHQLPTQFQKLLEDTSSQVSHALVSKPNIQYILDKVLSFGLELSDSVHIGRALADLNFGDGVNVAQVDKNLKGSLETVQLLSESLRNIETSSNHSYWISKSEIDGLMTNDTLLNLFFGLLAEKAKIDNIDLSSGSLFDILTSKSALDVKDLVESMITSIKSIEKIYNSNQGNIPDNQKYLVALQYFDAASDLINTSNHVAPLLSKSEANSLKKYNSLASDINDMTRSFVTKKYSIGLLYLTRVLNDIDSSSTAIVKINKVLGNQGLFIAQMAESESSDDVAAILENFAAPTGSWRDKRIAEWNIAIDSYIGPAFYNIQENDRRLAFSTPIGASITVPFNNLTFFVSAFDLGPLTSFRLSDDTSQIAKVYLKEILSPGAFVSINFGENFPITLNAGYQQFPLLEKVGQTQNDVSVSREGGFSGSIVVNIPLFTMYNDPKD